MTSIKSLTIKACKRVNGERKKTGVIQYSMN